MFGAGINILLFLCLLISFQALFGGFGLVGCGAGIHDTHVVNTVCPLHPEVSDEYIPLQLSYILLRGPFEIFLTYIHGETCVDFGVVARLRGVEGLARKVSNPITELVVTLRDEASLLAVKGVTYFKFRASYIVFFS